MHKYKILSKKGEGTFSEVIKALCTKTGRLVAIKRMKSVFRSIDQVNNLREIQALKRLSNHPNVIKLLEVLYDRNTGRLALVFELMTCNLYELIKDRQQYLPESKVKLYIYQLLRALDFMHRNGIFHRDIKPENVLVTEDLVKLADLGSCRGIYTKQPFSEYISTRWYRAPECLLTDGFYNYKMDIWGVGCVFFEILMLYPLFPGSDELDQIHRIHNIMGTPSKQLLGKFKQSAHMSFDFPEVRGSGLGSLLKNAPSTLVDLLNHMLEYDPDKRYNAKQCLRHPYFKELRDADKRAESVADSPGIEPPLSQTKTVKDKRHNKTKKHDDSNSPENHSVKLEGTKELNDSGLPQLHRTEKDAVGGKTKKSDKQSLNSSQKSVTQSRLPAIGSEQTQSLPPSKPGKKKKEREDKTSLPPIKSKNVSNSPSHDHPSPARDSETLPPILLTSETQNSHIMSHPHRAGSLLGSSTLSSDQY
ncbi:putative MAPK/MAK/MRK overlapping kinase [Blattamonas nauphoetae]|uniref:MAPK/MAK/MRK overlapping kinase n=1 Tax=Blattamonas nauphoetae TaxID=2049346 RepID=A0ABQ9Y647_9EUKA|nr:putative MAPK/MAK/MRK overlapping kinase [Blattamonas nauphoetae]